MLLKVHMLKILVEYKEVMWQGLEITIFRTAYPTQGRGEPGAYRRELGGTEKPGDIPDAVPTHRKAK